MVTYATKIAPGASGYVFCALSTWALADRFLEGAVQQTKTSVPAAQRRGCHAPGGASRSACLCGGGRPRTCYFSDAGQCSHWSKAEGGPPVGCGAARAEATSTSAYSTMSCRGTNLFAYTYRRRAATGGVAALGLVDPPGRIRLMPSHWRLMSGQPLHRNPKVMGARGSFRDGRLARGVGRGHGRGRP